MFSDASESSYGALAYLCTEDKLGKIHLSFILARSKVAPKRVLSVPRLELCADVIGAQFTNLLKKELTLPLRHTVLWTDSTMVLSSIQSESCYFKSFRKYQSGWPTSLPTSQPGDTWIQFKIQQTTLHEERLWKSANPNRWSQGPPFLLLPPESWPANPVECPEFDKSELKKICILWSSSCKSTN